MTLTKSDVTDLLDAIRAGGDIDVIRKGVELVLQALIDAEATEVIGAERYERSGERTNWRNGNRDRLLATKAGDVELKIPKLRRGSFFPSILERRRRIDRALFAVVMEAYVHGVSTRKVDDLVTAFGAGSGISRSEVSRICASLDAEPAAFRARPLGHVEFPYVFLDATYLKGRIGGQVVSRAVVVATGVSMNGDREVLGCAVGDSEDETFWTAFLRSLRERGLTGVRLVISDHHLGLKKAIATVMIGAGWQRCRVHFMLGVSLGSTGAALQVVTVPPRSRPWLYFMLAPARPGAPVTSCRACCGSGGSRRWLERSLSCRTQLCRSGPAAPLHVERNVVWVALVPSAQLPFCAVVATRRPQVPVACGSTVARRQATRRAGGERGGRWPE